MSTRSAHARTRRGPEERNTLRARSRKRRPPASSSSTLQSAPDALSSTAVGAGGSTNRAVARARHRPRQRCRLLGESPSCSQNSRTFRPLESKRSRILRHSRSERRIRPDLLPAAIARSSLTGRRRNIRRARSCSEAEGREEGRRCLTAYHVPGGRAPARGNAPGLGGRAAHAEALEGALRRPADALRSRRRQERRFMTAYAWPFMFPARQPRLPRGSLDNWPSLLDPSKRPRSRYHTTRVRTPPAHSPSRQPRT